MNRNTVLLIIAASVLGGGLIYAVITMRSSLKQAIDDLRNSQHKIDSAIIGINAARSEIQDLQTKTDKFQEYTGQISKSVSDLDMHMAASNAVFRSTMADLSRRISLIKDSIKIATSDSFPPDIPRGILKTGINK